MIKTFRFALLACGLVGGALTATAAPAVPVRVATVELAPHAEERAIPGRVEAIRAVDIRARTEGVIVQRHFQDGQYVTEGDLLFTLDDAQPRAALALAQAELKSAEASLRQSQQLLTRYERLINNHSISRNDVDTARMQRDVAAAAVQQAKARVEAQQIVLSYTQIAAPVTGRVGHSAFHVGTLVNSSSGVLVDIVQLDPVRVSFALDEAAFFSKTGQHADIHALKQAWLAQIEVDGKRRDGVLTSIDNRIDARTGSVAVRAEFANPQHRLLPGGSEPPAIIAAWQRGDIDGAYVWAPAVNELEKEGKVLTDSSQVGEWGAPTLDVWVVRKDFAEQHPEIVKAFAKSAIDAQQPYIANPEAWLKQPDNISKLARLSGVPEADVPGLVKGNTYLTAAEQAQALNGPVNQAIVDTARFLKEQGKVPAAGTDYRQYVTDRFVK